MHNVGIRARTLVAVALAALLAACGQSESAVEPKPSASPETVDESPAAQRSPRSKSSRDPKNSKDNAPDINVSADEPVAEGQDPNEAPEKLEVPEGWDYPDAFEANAFVLENREHGPELCFGGVATSLPPQCGGVPAIDWDWEEVEGEESRSGSTWGYFYVMGSYDGDTFTVEDAGKPKRGLDGGPHYGPTRSACSERKPTDRDRWTSQHLDRSTRYANRRREVSAVWIDYLKDPRKNEESEDPDEVVLNVAFTKRIEHHEKKLRKIWGGPLCVVEYEYSRHYLQAIQKELHDEMGRRLDLDINASGIDEVASEVELEVVWIDRARRDYIDARYGRGVVKTFAALHPLP